MIKQKITGPSKVSIDTSVDEILHLREENFRLKALLESHGISWEVEPDDFPSIKNHSDQEISLSLLIKKLLFLDACSGEETMFIQSAGNQQKEGLAIPPPVVMSGTKVYVISLK